MPIIVLGIIIGQLRRVLLKILGKFDNDLLRGHHFVDVESDGVDSKRLLLVLAPPK
jgi:hypothetical protein